ncbi:MAG: DUF2029 domain-containing protein [Planctomycetota bacterium]|nr:MAG: DUF2029 domain-containing protein [Planctomycetota bacterium]
MSERCGPPPPTAPPWPDRLEGLLRRARPLGAALLLAGVALLAARALRHPERGDTRFYREGARRYWAGENLYYFAPLGSPPTGIRNNTSFTYPPPFAALSGWMLALPYPAVRVVWLVLGVACAAASFALAWRLVAARAPPVRPHLAAVLCLGLLLRFAVNDLAHGQVNWLLVLLLLGGLHRAERGHSLAGGALVGAALSVKPTAWPLLALYAVGRRDLRFAGGALGCAGLLLGASLLRYGVHAPTLVRDWLALMQGFAELSAQSPGNASLPGLFARLGAGLPRGEERWILLGKLDPRVALAWARGATLLLVLPCLGWLCLRRGRRPRAPAAALVLGALASPVTWKAHLVVLVLPLAWLCSDVARHPQRRRGWLLLAALFAALVLPSRALLHSEALDAYGATTAGLLLCLGALLASDEGGADLSADAAAPRAPTGRPTP